LNIPKLDLSKIKRDVDLENNPCEDDVADGISETDQDEFMDDQSEILGADDDDQPDIIIDDLKVNDYSDTEEDLLNDLKSHKLDTLDVKEQDLMKRKN
jgi:hypothetical protein